MKRMLRTLSWMLCFLMLIQCGGMIALPAVAGTTQSTGTTDVFTLLNEDFDSYEVGAISAIDGVELVKGVPIIVEESGRGKVALFSAADSPNIKIPSERINKMISFDFKMNADLTGTYGGLYVWPYKNADDPTDQLYAIFSNGKSISSLGSTGGVSIKDGANTSIAFSNLEYETKWYSVRMMQFEKKLYVKVWVAGTEEPLAWSCSGATTASAIQTDDAPILFGFNKANGSDDLNFWLDNLRVEKVIAEDFEDDKTECTIMSKGTVVSAVDATHGRVITNKSGESGTVLTATVGQIDKEVTFDLLFNSAPKTNWGVFVYTYFNATTTSIAGKSQNVYSILGQNVQYNSERTGIRQTCDHSQANGFGTVSTALTWNNNVWYSVKLRLDGRNYYGKVWQQGTAEPEAWTAYGTIASEALLMDEGSAVWLSPNNANAQIDNLVITSVPRGLPVKITATSEDESLGSVSVSGTVQDNGFKAGSNVTLTATPAVGCQFEGWYLNGALVSYAPVYSFTAGEYADYAAKFSAAPAYTWFSDDYSSYEPGAINRDDMPLSYVSFTNEDRISIVEENGDQYLQAYGANFELDCAIIEKQVTFDFLYESSYASYGGIYVYLLKSPDTNSEQYCQIMPNYGSKNLGVSSNVNGNLYPQKFLQHSLSPMVWYSCKSQMLGDKIYMKVWPKSETEPVGWSLVHTIGSAISSDENARFILTTSDTDGDAPITRFDNVQIKTWIELYPKKEVRLNLEVNDEAMGTVSGGGRYLEGNTVTVKAQPNQGYAFLNWTDSEGTVVSTMENTSYQLGSETEQTLTANFRKYDPQVLSFMANGMTGPAVFDRENKTIEVTFASDIDLTKVRPYFYIEDDDGTAKANPYDLMDLSKGKAVELTNGWTVTAKQNKVMKQFYVDGINGSDEYDGSSKKPFKTVERARDAVREIAEWSGDVFVNIADGEYFCAEPVAFDTRDSAENGCAIIYRALNADEGKVVFTGGQKLSGWVKSDEVESAWEVSVPGKPYARTLYVDGKTAILARSDGIDGTLTLDHSVTGYRLSGNLADMKNWRNIDNIEFVYDIKWTYNIVPVASATAETVTMLEAPFLAGTGRGVWPLTTPTFIQNCFEYLDEEGEWYFDEAEEKIYYIPIGGADPNEQEIVLPCVEQLVTVTGEADGTTVNGLGFQNLTFEYTDYLQPGTHGQIDAQAACVGKYEGIKDQKTAASIQVNYASGLRFAGNVFHCLGENGLDLSRGVSDTTVADNEFTQIGANAVIAGHITMEDAQPFAESYISDRANNIRTELTPNPHRVTEHIFVFSNDIYEIATSHKSGCGIFVPFARDITVAHNRLNNLPYTGISIGWGWGRFDQGGRPSANYYFETPSVMARYVVENNHITKMMQRLYDGGAIYTLSYMPGSVISGNYISEVSAPFGNIYLDEGAGGFVEISENICTSDNYRPYFYHSVEGNFYNEYKNACASLLETGNNFMDVDSSDDPLYELIKTRAGQVDAPYTVHHEVIIEGKDATCTESGLTDGKVCADCGETLVAQEEIPALGHNRSLVEDGSVACGNCGMEMSAHDGMNLIGGTYYLFADGKLADTVETGLLYQWNTYGQLVLIGGRPAANGVYTIDGEQTYVYNHKPANRLMAVNDAAMAEAFGIETGRSYLFVDGQLADTEKTGLLYDWTASYPQLIMSHGRPAANGVYTINGERCYVLNNKLANKILVANADMAEAFGIEAGKSYLFAEGKLADSEETGLRYDWSGYKALIMSGGRPAANGVYTIGEETIYVVNNLPANKIVMINDAAEAEALGITAGKNYLFVDGKLADTATSGLLYDWGGYKQLVMVNGRPA